MHQARNIPWQIIEDNFKFVYQNRSFTPWRTGLLTKGRESMPQDLKHFTRKLIEAIKIFSSTERQKYPAKFELPSSGKLFSDVLLNRYPEYLNEGNQLIENWIAASKSVQVGGKPSISYDTRHGSLANVVKILLQENQLPTLLMLAQHPDIPLHRLNNLSWGNHFGVSRVKEAALHMYIYINAAEATGTLYTGQYTTSEEFVSILKEVAVSMDYPAQQLPHRQFLTECGVLYNGQFSLNADSESQPQLYIHQDQDRLREYLKTLFALMYRYDVLVRECGLNPEWEQDIAWCSPLRGYLKVEQKWVEEENRWVSYIP